jgi:hypothetical protein
MSSLLIFKIWRHKLPALWAILTIAFVFLWPSIPLGGLAKWLQFFYFYTPQNYLYAFLSILSGLYVGIYVYNKKVAACCSIDSARTGAVGSITGILLGACPACIPVLAVLLPLSITIVLSRLSLIFLVIAILIMLFSIYRMNGFKRFA